jgi:hypothetical protein
MKPICDIQGCLEEAYVLIVQSPEPNLLDKYVCEKHWKGDFSQLKEIQTRFPEGAEL